MIEIDPVTDERHLDAREQSFEIGLFSGVADQ